MQRRKSGSEDDRSGEQEKIMGSNKMQTSLSIIPFNESKEKIKISVTGRDAQTKNTKTDKLLHTPQCSCAPPRTLYLEFLNCNNHDILLAIGFSQNIWCLKLFHTPTKKTDHFTILPRVPTAPGLQYLGNGSPVSCDFLYAISQLYY